MNRRSANDQILRSLQTYLAQNPDIRFGQALVNLEVIKLEQVNVALGGPPPGDGSGGHRERLMAADPFYEEPETTYRRMCEAYAKQQGR